MVRPSTEIIVALGTTYCEAHAKFGKKLEKAGEDLWTTFLGGEDWIW
jgi:hypothetical protein